MRFLLAAWAAARATSQAPTLNASSLLNATAAPSSQRHCAFTKVKKKECPKTYGNRSALGDALRLCEAEEKCIGVFRQCEESERVLVKDEWVTKCVQRYEARDWVRCKSAGKDHCGREKFDWTAGDTHEIYTCEAYEERPKMMSAAV